MKFKGLLFATVAMAGLASCSSDNNVADNIVGADKALTVNVSAANTSLTRGLVEETINNSKARVDTENVWAYLLRGNQQMAKQKVLFDNNTDGSAKFANLTIQANDRVVITGNALAGTTTTTGYKIEDVQPTANKGGVKSVLYYDVKNLDFVEKDEVNKLFKVNMQLKPEAARTEVYGAIKANPKLIVSSTVDQITPNNYHHTIGNTETFKAVLGNLGKLALENDFYSKITNGDKVVANHLFNGSEKRITFRLNAVIYDVVKIKDAVNKTSKNQLVDAAQPQSYIFQGKNDKFYVETDPRSLEAVTKLVELEESATGTILIGEKKYAKSATELTNLSQLKTYTTVIDAPSSGDGLALRGYFQLVKFAPVNTNGTLASTTFDYEQGKIYKISFEKIDWNRDGSINNDDHFSPGDAGQDGEDGGNGGTEPTPTDNKYDVQVGATIMDWTFEEVGSELE